MESDVLPVSTVCPRRSDQFYIVTCCIKWVTTSWTYSIYLPHIKERQIWFFVGFGMFYVHAKAKAIG